MSSRLPRRLVLLGLALLPAVLQGPAARAQSLETFVLTVGGNSSGPSGCTTFAAPGPVLSNFGPHGPSLPAGGLVGCGVDGDYRSATATSGPLADAMTLGTSWNTGGWNQLDADTRARAGYGDLAARAHSDLAFTSGYGGTLVAGAEGFGLFTDGLKLTSPSVSDGKLGALRVLVVVSGGLSASANGTADVELVYRVNTGPTFTMFRAQAFGAVALPFVISATGNGTSGFALSPGAMSGAGVIDTLTIPFVFGTSFDLRLGLLAYVVPGAISSILDADFQARIVGFQVAGPGGQPVTDFVVTSASGTDYGPSFCTAKVNSAGCTPALSTSGKPTLTGPDDFHVLAGQLIGQTKGVLHWSLAPNPSVALVAGAPSRPRLGFAIRGGVMCLSDGKVFGGALSGGTAGACDGVLDFHLTQAFFGQQGLTAGTTVYVQAWYADPSHPDLTGIGHTGGWELTLLP